MLFFEKLQCLRKQAGLTQQQMADVLDITANAYQNYEYGKRTPSIETLLYLSCFFNVSLDELLCRDDWMRAHAAFFDEH